MNMNNIISESKTLKIKIVVQEHDDGVDLAVELLTAQEVVVKLIGEG